MGDYDPHSSSGPRATSSVARHLCGDARRAHHAARRRLHQDGPPRPGQGREAVQGHGGALRRLRLRSGRRAGRGGADRALLHGRRGLQRRTPRPSCRACSWPARTPSGMHGANRLGGNGVANSTVFGGIAGDDDAALDRGQSGPSSARRSMCWMPRWRARCIRSRARPATSTGCANGCSTPCGTMSASSAIAPGSTGHSPRSMRSRPNCWRPGVPDGNRAFNLTWHDWLNLRSLTEISRVIALAARQRENSRGAHFREDFPGAGRSWRPRTFTSRVQTGQRPVEITDHPVLFTIVTARRLTLLQSTRPPAE